MNQINIPKYLYCENLTDLPGTGLVLQTNAGVKNTFPTQIVGVICKFESELQMMDFVSKTNYLAYKDVPGYNICIRFGGTMRIRLPFFSNDALTMIKQTIDEMAQWYLDHYIQHHKEDHLLFIRSVAVR